MIRINHIPGLLALFILLSITACSRPSDARAPAGGLDERLEMIDQTLVPAPPPGIEEADWTAGGPVVWEFAGENAMRRAEDGTYSADGWKLTSQVGTPEINRGRLIITPTGNDPQMHFEGAFDLRTHDALEVRLASEVDTNVGVFWALDGEPFTGERASVARVEGGSMQVVRLPIGGIAQFPRRVTALRFDPTDSMARVGIDRIQLLTADPDSAKVLFASTSFSLEDDRRPGRMFAGSFQSVSLIDLPAAPKLEYTVANLAPELPMLLRVEVEDVASRTRESFEASVSPESRWEEVVFDLARLADRRARVTTTLTLADPNATGILGPTRVLERRANTQPDVLLIAIDTLRADRVSAYGHSRLTTPNLDRLAQRAVRFDRPVTQSPWTLPSVASYLTSAYPRALGIHFVVRHSIPDNVPTIAEILREEGYDTACVFANSVMERDIGYERGFASFAFAERAEFRADEVTDRALAWLESHEPRRKFLYLHYMDPHSPYRPPDESWRANPFFREADTNDVPLSNTDFFYRHATATREDTEKMLRLYDAEIFHADAQIGRVLDALDADGRLDDMLVIVTSDHGEEFDDHGNWNHALTLYDEMLRVPLIVKFPNDAGAGTVVSTSTPLLDIAPTIFETVGVPYSHLALEGLPMNRLLDGDTSGADRDLFSETNSHGPVRTAIVTPRWKLARFEIDHGYWNDKDVLWKWMQAGIPPVALFDRERDPGELENVFEKHPDVVDELTARIRAFRNEKSAVAPPFDGAKSRPAEDSETVRKLRALGYLPEESEAEAKPAGEGGH